MMKTNTDSFLHLESSHVSLLNLFGEECFMRHRLCQYIQREVISVATELGSLVFEKNTEVCSFKYRKGEKNG